MSDEMYFRQGKSSALGLSATTVVAVRVPDFSLGECRVLRVSVTTAGTTAGSIYDASTAAGAVAANLIASIPAVVGVYLIDFPCINGILYVPGTGQVASISYS